MKTSSLLQGLALSLLALSLQACLSPDSVVCASGLLCPPGHSCSANQDSCISNSCGNGIVEPEFGEVCDDGNVKSHDGCSADCSSTEQCGNGVVDTSVGEKCDDGNQLSGDGCSADCKSDESCGNGVVDQGEMCDTGALTLAPGQRCSADCKSDLRCGNGITDPGELCDDGNNKNGDGCSADCHSKELCGNYVRDGAEECDVGPVNTDTCINCHVPRCGDGLTEGREQCDTRGESGSCNLNCTRSQCGDGVVNKSAGEECDPGLMSDGHAIDSATCTRECKISKCGDGVTNKTAGEECDPGRTVNGHAVDSADCTHECKSSSCGDGYINVAAGEQCDDGNANECGTCDAKCQSSQTPELVTGTLRAAAGGEFESGEWFSLSDGRTDLSFEFQFQKDPVGNVPGALKVLISKDMTDNQVAKAIRTVIDSAPALDIETTLDGNSNTIGLKNTRRRPTIDSKRETITESVKSTHFVVTGMTMEASACSSGVGCTTDADCVSGRCKLSDGHYVCR